MGLVIISLKKKLYSVQKHNIYVKMKICAFKIKPVKNKYRNNIL